MMLVWLALALVVALAVVVVAVRVAAAVLPLYWVTKPEQVRHWAQVLPVVEATAVIPPPRRELEP